MRAGDVGVGEELRADAGGDVARAAVDRQLGALVARPAEHVAVGVEHLDERRRAAAARGQVPEARPGRRRAAGPRAPNAAWSCSAPSTSEISWSRTAM